MWKKLFYNASKNIANDVSRAYANEKKKQMIQNKNQSLAEQYRRDTIAEHQQDDEFQERIEEIDIRLEYLIETNFLADYCLTLLEDPLENMYLLDLIVNNIERLRPITNELIESAEFENEYFQEVITNTVNPFLHITTIMFGNNEEEDFDGILGLIALHNEYPNQDQELFDELIPQSIQLITASKDQIKTMFQESKEGQIVRYVAYDIEGEIDFGTHTIEELL